MNTDQDSTRQLPYNPVSALPSAAVSGSAASCQLCGERLRGQIWEWGSYETLCGLCVDDLMNKDYKARHDMAMKKQKPPNDALCHPAGSGRGAQDNDPKTYEQES